MDVFWGLVVSVLLVGLGVFFGWLRWRWRRRSIPAIEWAATQDRIHSLETAVAGAERDRNALDVQRLAAVEERGTAERSLSVARSDLGTQRQRVDDLEQVLTDLRNEPPPDCGHGPIIDRFERQLADMTRSEEQLRDELERLRQDVVAAAIAEPVPAEPVAAVPAWQLGTTTLGTPGAAHQDDLKVINGIGPKMESMLNAFRIRSWEQLAALTPSEVQRVDDALAEFPGRIERDEWVEQASGLVEQFPDHTTRPTRATFLNPGVS